MKIETGKINQAHTKDLMHSINKVNGKITDKKTLLPDVPFHPGLVYRPPSKLIRHNTSNQQSSKSSPSIEDIKSNINLCFEENSPFQEGVYQLPVDIKEIHAGCLHSSYFKDIFLYLSQNVNKVEALSE